MNRKMTMTGIGPKIAVFTLPYLILSIVLTIICSDYFAIDFVPRILTLAVGIIMLSLGLILYVTTVRIFLSEFKKGKLITKGTFSLCRNPLYSSIILFIIPGAGLIANTWIIVTVSLLAYGVFKLFIKEETSVLKDNFGVKYEEYRNSVNEFLPIPRLNINRFN